MTSFDAFLDDAAVFPPGSADLAEAVAAHVARRTSASGRLVGPFVCPAERLDDLVALPGADGLQVAVVASAPFTVPAGVSVACVETRVADLPVPPGVRRVVEVGWDRPLDAPSGVLVKLRTGGADAAAIPAPEVLATALARLVRAERPFKLTAGLHRLVRAVDPADGLLHHGFGNVLLTVDAVLAGGSDADAAATLARTDAGVGADLVALGPGRLAAARSFFTSFGTCSIDEPTTDLAALGLLDERMPA